MQGPTREKAMRENEDADPVGAPVSDSTRRRSGAATATSDAPPRERKLGEEEADFTSEGAPPPGKVATDAPALPTKHDTRSRP